MTTHIFLFSNLFDGGTTKKLFLLYAQFVGFTASFVFDIFSFFLFAIMFSGLLLSRSYSYLSNCLWIYDTATLLRLAVCHLVFFYLSLKYRVCKDYTVCIIQYMAVTLAALRTSVHNGSFVGHVSTSITGRLTTLMPLLLTNGVMDAEVCPTWPIVCKNFTEQAAPTRRI